MAGSRSADLAWIDRLTDEQCKEIFWLYLESPEEFFAQHSTALLGQAMRFALREVAQQPESAEEDPR